MIRYFIVIVLLCCVPLQAHAQQKPTINILFVGNSYTYYHKMPLILQAMINQSASSPIKANIQSVVQGGANYQNHWDNQYLHTALSDGTQWHYVILQNQSDWAARENTRRHAHYYARQIANKINKVGAVPVIFITWPKKQGTVHYRERPYLKNFASSYRDLNVYSTQLAKKLNAQTVPVNDYWLSSLQNNTDIDLYSDDGSHPSLAGSYLSALAFYKFFTGEALQNPSLSVKKLNAQTTKALQDTVANALPSSK